MRTLWLLLFLIIIGVSFYFLFSSIIPAYFPNLIPAKGEQNYYNTDINGNNFQLEVARTNEKREAGLSARNNMPQDHGMIFLFDVPGEYAFWMKGVRFPLDIIWLRDKKVVYIATNVRPSLELDPPKYTPNAEADAVIELNAGEAAKIGLRVGDRISY